jgi:hypothetical protein
MFFHVRPAKDRPAADVRPPLRDLRFERPIVKGRHAVHALIQIPRKAPSTTCHCWR